MAEFTCSADLPGRPTSPWLADSSDDGRSNGETTGSDPSDADTTDPTYEPLEAYEAADVAVVGAGIAGLSTAVRLRERGYSVVVLERDRVASGTTGKSTAKLTSQHGLVYDHLRREFGLEAARTYARVNEAAIDEVERRIEALDAECGFERVPSYCYGDDRDALEREAEAARAAGLEAASVRSAPPFERALAAVRFEDQAQFHPRRYLLALSEVIAGSEGCEVHERTRVTDVEPGTPCRLRTESGEAETGTTVAAETSATVAADAVVLATGYPLLDRAGYFARMYPKRSYVLGLRIRGRPPDGMYYRIGDPYRSVRTRRDSADELLLVGGENHKTGQGGSTVERYRRLLRWARERFPVESVEYRWSTQDYVTADRVPFVGRAGVGSGAVYVATGFRGWGMTNGVAAGRLLAALVDGEDPPGRALFDPLRFAPKAAAAKTLTENADAASQFATDWLRTLFEPEGTAIDRGEGRVVREGGRPIAVARDDDGRLRAVSAVCTHQRCLVEWNDAECSWDCPCHGSRFAPDGRVLEGPATEDLPARDPGRR